MAQRYAHHLNGSATTASNPVSFIGALGPTHYAHNTKGHESNGCPHPRTTESTLQLDAGQYLEEQTYKFNS